MNSAATPKSDHSRDHDLSKGDVESRRMLKETKPNQRVVSILIAIGIIAWSSRNFWSNIEQFWQWRAASNTESDQFQTQVILWGSFLFVLVVVPFLFGVWLLWKSFSAAAGTPPRTSE